MLTPQKVVGLDVSDRFLTVARASATPRMAFFRHDVRSTPFPVGPSDLIYCRFLLSHLPEPARLIEPWATQLRSKAMLMIEETESIDTTNPVFKQYLDVVQAMLAEQGANLFIGPALSRLPSGTNLKLAHNQVVAIDVQTRQAAQMFEMNLGAWKDRPFIRKNYCPKVVEELQEQLRQLAVSSERDSEIVWQLRQISVVNS